MDLLGRAAPRGKSTLTRYATNQIERADVAAVKGAMSLEIAARHQHAFQGNVQTLTVKRVTSGLRR
jgi:hypothetical protein